MEPGRACARAGPGNEVHHYGHIRPTHLPTIGRPPSGSSTSPLVVFPLELQAAIIIGHLVVSIIGLLAEVDVVDRASPAVGAEGPVCCYQGGTLA